MNELLVIDKNTWNYNRAQIIFIRYECLISYNCGKNSLETTTQKM